MEQAIREIQKKLDRIIEVIVGDPTDENKPGIMIRIDRLERANKTKSRIVWVLATGLILAAANSLVTLL